MLKIDMHIHTFYSKDCMMSLEEVVKAVEIKRLHAVAVTDHNTLQGALKIKEIAPFRVIVGEEIKTKEGEITGYFLQEEIPSELSPEETIMRIKSQKGLVCIPHPFDRLRKSRLSYQSLEKIKKTVDIIEVFNSRNVFSKDDERALTFAKQNGFVKIAGSDAHTKYEVGNGYIEIEDFNSPKEFLENLKNCKIYSKKSCIFLHGITKYIKMRSRFKV